MGESGRRIRTAVVLLVALVLVLSEAYAIVVLFLLLLFVVGLLAAWEWSGLLELGRTGRFAYVAVCMSVVSFFSVGYPWPFPWPVALVLWGLVLLPLAGVSAPDTVERTFFGLLGLVAIPSVLRADVTGIPWGLLAVVIVANMAAYGVDRCYGRIALAPDISPNKTRAGLVGALVAVAGLSVPIAWGLDLPPDTWFYYGCLTLLTACFSVVGNLAVGLMKRRANVKDSRTPLPESSGFLSRVSPPMASLIFLAATLGFFALCVSFYVMGYALAYAAFDAGGFRDFWVGVKTSLINLALLTPLVALLAVCIGAIGCLTGRLVKHRTKVRGGGGLLPGHGGILDWVGGLLAAAPVYLVGLSALEWR